MRQSLARWSFVCVLGFAFLLGGISQTQAAVTVITRYVDTDNGTDDGSHGTGSGSDAWATWSYAESLIDDYGENSDGDFTATGGTYPEGIRVVLYLAGSAADTTFVEVDGCAMDSTHYLHVIGDGNYTLSVADRDALLIGDDWVICENLNLVLSSADGNGDDVVVVYGPAPSSEVIFIGCTLKGPDNDTYSCRGVVFNDLDTALSLNNCLIYDMGQNAASYGFYNVLGTAYVYNCTIDNAYCGVSSANSVNANTDVKNTIVCGSDGSAYLDSGAGTLELWNSTADDATAGTFDQGSDCHDSVTPTFTGTYQLAATDTTWIDGGASLSADGYWFDDDVDYADTARPQGSAWDIGWHEYEQAAGGGGTLKLKLLLTAFWRR